MPTENIGILCVENDADSCDLYEALFKNADERCRLKFVETADEAIVLLKKEVFRLVILDCWLPNKAGIELCRELREFDAQTPVLFYTAEERESEREKMLAAGATQVLVKAVDFDEFVPTALRLVAEVRTKLKIAV